MPTTITASAQAPLIKEFIRGGTYVFDITVTNQSDGSAFNLTGATVFVTFNTSQTPAVDPTDSSAALKASTSSFAAPLTGRALVTVSSTATAALAEGTYYYDVKVIDGAGNSIPIGKNRVLVKDGITTRTS